MNSSVSPRAWTTLFAFSVMTLFFRVQGLEPASASGSEPEADAAMSHAILSYVSPTGATVAAVKGYEDAAKDRAKAIAAVIDKRRPRGGADSVSPRIQIFQNSEELWKALGASLEIGASYEIKGACEEITPDYPTCTDKGAPGVTWKHEYLTHFHHCVANSTATTTCTGTQDIVGYIYSYATLDNCTKDFARTGSQTVTDMYCSKE